MHLTFSLVRLSACFVFVSSLACVTIGQSPLNVEDALRSIRVDPQLEVQLVASEPMVQDPVAICWDSQGAMYVAEMGDYPDSQLGGRIKKLVDRDRDGKADDFTVFVEQVAFPTSVLPLQDGILVAAAPDIFWFCDTDGDGVADVRKTVLTGFGTGNQQLRVNGLTWGLDNYIYGANGRSDGEISMVHQGRPTTEKLSIRNSDFRFRLDGKVELAGGFTQFGQSFDDFGQRFISWNTIHIRHVVMEQRYLNNNRNAALTATAREISDSGSTPRVYPISSTTKRFNAEPPGFFNASCGLTIYRGDWLGSAFAGNAFACEPLSNLVHRDVLQSEGPSFLAKHPDQESTREFLASTDIWFRPVNLATGPDGALYVVDFYRKWVEHPQWVADESARKSVDFSEGKEFGRIYRVVPRESTDKNRTWAVDLDRLNDVQLVEKLSSTNAWQRETSQRLLIDRGASEEAILKIRSILDEGGSDSANVHALGALLGLGKLDRHALLKGLSTKHPLVRRFAVQLAERVLDDREVVDRVCSLSQDADPHVRFQVACSLGFAPRSRKVASALAHVLFLDGKDPWSRQAVFTAASGLTVEILDELASLWKSKLEVDVDQLRWLVDFIRSEAKVVQVNWLEVLTKRDLSEHWRAMISLALLRSLPDRSAQVSLMNKSPGFQEMLRRCEQWIGSDSVDITDKLVAVGLLEFGDEGRALEILEPALQADQPMDMQLWSIATLAARPSTKAARLLVDAIGPASPSIKRSLIDTLIGRGELRSELVKYLANGSLKMNQLDRLQQQMLLQQVGPDQRKQLEPLMAHSSQGSRSEVVARYIGALDTAGDVKAGHQLYRQLCQSCHARNGEGHRVGPDLTAIVGRTPQDILVDILDPNRSVSADSFSYGLVTQDERVLTGIIAAESSNSITLKQAGGISESILRSDIRELKRFDRSLMPEGFEESMTPAQLSSLISFLKSPLSE